MDHQVDFPVVVLVAEVAAGSFFLAFAKIAGSHTRLVFHICIFDNHIVLALHYIYEIM